MKKTSRGCRSVPRRQTGHGAPRTWLSSWLLRLGRSAMPFVSRVVRGSLFTDKPVVGPPLRKIGNTPRFFWTYLVCFTLFFRRELPP
jgi:hypothetical protein